MVSHEFAEEGIGASCVLRRHKLPMLVFVKYLFEYLGRAMEVQTQALARCSAV